MSKKAKKLLSVVLAVLVLATGFSTMLGSFVMAEPKWTYNYDQLIPEFDGTNEKFLAELGSGVTRGTTAAAPDSFGFSDYFGIATNINAGHIGLRPSEKFFSKSNAGAAVIYGGDASEVHPYFTYEVEPGTEFAIQYETYARYQWDEFNLADKTEEYRFLQILVSSDGVNFVPAKFENKETLTGTDYDVVNVNIENVGADTRFVKVQFPFDTTVVTQQKDKDGKWFDSYVPQEAFFVQKVKLTARASTETAINFANQRVTAYADDGVTPKSWETYMSVNGTETNRLGDIFISYPNMTGLEVGGLRCFPHNNSAKEDLSQAWGYHAEYKRDFFLRVQPGTRFYLSYNDNVDHYKAGTSLVENGIFEKVEDFGWAVYSAENLIDFENGKATKHEIVPISVPTKDIVVNIKYNFIIPENHTYIKIVDPISGGLDTISFKEGTYKIDYRGNDRVVLDHITYTPFSTTYEKEYNYCTRDGYTFKPGDKAANGVYSYFGFGDGSGQKIGFAASRTENYMFNVAGKAIRTDNQLMYVTYKVHGGTFFNAALDVKWGENSIWYKKAYDDNNKDLRDNTSADYGKEYEDFYFEILTSADGNDWTTVATLGRNEDIYIQQSVSDSMKYNVGVYVPKGHSFVKILSHFRAGYKSGSNNVVFNNTFAVSGVSYNATPAEQVGEETYDYSTLSTTSGEVLSNNNLEKFGIYGISTHSCSTLKNYEASKRPGIASIYQNFVAANVDNEWGDVEPAYLIYKVEPGTVFTPTFFLSSNTGSVYCKEEISKALVAKKAAVEAAGGEWHWPTDFEFKIESSASATGGWTNTATTKGITTSEFEYDYFVPEDCSYVKITYPQYGYVYVGTTQIAGNDCAILTKVSYVPYGTSGINDYAGKLDGVNLDNNESKLAYEIYEVKDVAGDANGVTANADGAYVTYKVSNKEALVIKSANELDFEVSYGDKFVDAQLYKVNGVYTVNVVEGKQYVKVNLDKGETITAVKASALNPTVTFSIPHLNKTVEVDTAYGESAVAPTYNARPGYKITDWDLEFDKIYLDKVVTLQYEKKEAAEDLFTVGLDAASATLGAKITYAGGRTATTVRFDDRVTIEAPTTKGEEVFDRWVDANDRAISNSHKFSFLASGDLTIKAVYEESKKPIDPFIYNSTSAIVTDNGEKWNMSVIWTVNAYANANITETGILFATSDLGAEANSKEECDAAWKAGIKAETAKVMRHRTTAVNKTLMYTVNNIAAEKNERYALPYAIINGEYIFGEVVTAAN